MRMRWQLAQFSNVALMSFGPLSQRITWGSPRQAMICVSTRIIRCDGSEKSTSMPNASRLKSSIALSSRMQRPSSSCSCMKSMDQTALQVSGALGGSGLSRTNRLLGLGDAGISSIDHRNSAGSNGAVAAGGQDTHAGHRIAQCWSRKSGAPRRPL